jgi:hypothetical protein
MKRPARLLFAACLVTIAGVGSGFATAAEVSAVEQDLVNVKASNQVMSAVWKRQPDSYTVQIVLDRSMYSARAGKPASPQQDAAGKTPSSAGVAEEMHRLGIVNVSDALLTLVPRYIPGTPQPKLVRDDPGTADASGGGMENIDRSSFFIGNTIANLRGIDPWIACGRPLTLIDGRRITQTQSAPAVAPPDPAPARAPAPVIPNARERRVEVWLLKADGTHIQPATYTCDDPARTAPARKDVSISYGYALADSAQAVAAAIRIDGDFYIEKLQPLAAATAAAQGATPSCPVTRPNVQHAPSYFGNDVLQVGLPADGTYVFKPGGPGSVSTRDGALGIKVAWILSVPGQLRIEGRRLDGKSAPLRANLGGQLGPNNLQPTTEIFPEPGCWEVTGHIGSASLKYVVLVTKIGDGPSGRDDF